MEDKDIKITNILILGFITFLIWGFIFKPVNQQPINEGIVVVDFRPLAENPFFYIFLIVIGIVMIVFFKSNGFEEKKCEVSDE